MTQKESRIRSTFTTPVQVFVLVRKLIIGLESIPGQAPVWVHLGGPEDASVFNGLDPDSALGFGALNGLHLGL